MPLPSRQDQIDALDHAGSMGGVDLRLEDFDLEDLGDLSVDDLAQYDDLGSWVDLDRADFIDLNEAAAREELSSFRGADWSKRAMGWIKNGIPPVLVVEGPIAPGGESATVLGDGRGRVNLAVALGIEKLPAYILRYKHQVNSTVQARATRAPRKLMFHGTSNGPGDSRLRSIIKQGLVPTAKKTWDVDPDAQNARQRSRVSYGGLYFADSPQVAVSSVHRARTTQDQYPVIISALIQPRSALPDEDDLTFQVDHAFNRTMGANEAPSITGWLYRELHSEPTGTKHKERLAKFAAEMTDFLEEKKAMPKAGPSIQKFTDPLFNAEIVRRASNLVADDFKRYVVYPSVDHLRFDLGKKEATAADLLFPLREQPDYQTGEQGFRSALDALMKHVRRLAIGLEEAPRFRHTLRVLDPVTFSGKNKIVGIVSLPDYYSRHAGDKVTVRVHYGDEEPVVSYLKSQGYDNVVVENAKGKISVAASAVDASGVTWADPPLYSNTDYKKRGGRIVQMKPEDFLALARPLTLDDESVENIENLADVMQSGRGMDPPVLYIRSHTVQDHDGRHRAHAALQLGLTTIPVLLLDLSGLEAPTTAVGLRPQAHPSKRNAAAETPTRFWGRQGAGAVFYAEDTGRILLQHRSPWVNEPNTWGTYGGKIDADEDPQQALEREIKEESGYMGPMRVEPVNIFRSGDFSFHNFLVVVPEEFEPQHSWETSGHTWVHLDDLPSPLHFGMEKLLPALKRRLGTSETVETAHE